MVKITAIILLIFLEGCIPQNKDANGKRLVEVLGCELIINEEPLETHQEKYNVALLLKNHSSDTVGVILSNPKPLFTIPNTPIKLPCEPSENETGFSIVKDDMRFRLIRIRASELILSPNSEINLAFAIFHPLMASFDDEQMEEICRKGVISYKSPCDSIVEDYFSPGVRWAKEVMIRK